MQKQTLKDRQNRTIGYIYIDTNGKQTLKDARMQTKGYYDPKTDKTKDRRMQTVGKGNLLATLLYDE